MSARPVRIVRAVHAADVGAARRLFREYADSLSVDLCFQGFTEELQRLPGEYSSPGGALFLARAADRWAGCGALRRESEGVGELKRIYVRPRFRGRGLGARLLRRLLTEARHRGYRRVVLDTLPEMGAALRMYERFGFVPTRAYRPNPVPGARYLALDLPPLTGNRASPRDPNS